MFAALQVYKIDNGDCIMPARWPDNPQLANWVRVQRSARQRDKLSPERTARLDALGFVWNRFDVAWDEMFAALQVYKAEHGDCKVPQGWPDNSQLANWVTTQRSNKKQGRLSDKRIARLEAEGFEWQVRQSK